MQEPLVNMLAKRGLSISYDRLRQLITIWEQTVEVLPAQGNTEKGEWLQEKTGALPKSCLHYQPSHLAQTDCTLSMLY